MRQAPAISKPKPHARCSFGARVLPARRDLATEAELLRAELDHIRIAAGLLHPARWRRGALGDGAVARGGAAQRREHVGDARRVIDRAHERGQVVHPGPVSRDGRDVRHQRLPLGVGDECAQPLVLLRRQCIALLRDQTARERRTLRRLARSISPASPSRFICRRPLQVVVHRCGGLGRPGTAGTVATLRDPCEPQQREHANAFMCLPKRKNGDDLPPSPSCLRASGLTYFCETCVGFCASSFFGCPALAVSAGLASSFLGAGASLALSAVLPSRPWPCRPSWAPRCHCRASGTQRRGSRRTAMQRWRASS